jgi:hypothetical protein
LKNNLRNAARGRECQIRIPGVCNLNNDTVVLCHLPGGGIGRKQHDLLGGWGCSSCHDVVDGRVQISFSKDKIALWFLEGVIRTQTILLEEGVI